MCVVIHCTICYGNYLVHMHCNIGVCRCVCVYIYRYTHIYITIYTHMHSCAHSWSCACSYAYTNVIICSCMYIYIYIYLCFVIRTLCWHTLVCCTMWFTIAWFHTFDAKHMHEMPPRITQPYHIHNHMVCYRFCICIVIFKFLHVYMHTCKRHMHVNCWCDPCYTNALIHTYLITRMHTNIYIYIYTYICTHTHTYASSIHKHVAHTCKYVWQYMQHMCLHWDIYGMCIHACSAHMWKWIVSCAIHIVEWIHV